MTVWREWAYPIAEGDFEVLEDILMALPDPASVELFWERLPGFVAVVADVAAAVYLRLALENGRPTDEDGRPILEPNEVWVGADERARCENLLARNCPSPVRWFSYARIAFATAEAHRRFGAAYTAATGLPNAASVRSSKPSS